MAGHYVEELDSSLQAHYSPRDPLAEFLRGEISGRQLRVITEGLPLDSAFVRAMNGHSWQEETVILHDISTSLRALHTMLGQALGAKPKPKFRPLPTPFIDGKSAVATAQEKALAKQQRTEMDRTMQRIFANPN